MAWWTQANMTMGRGRSKLALFSTLFLPDLSAMIRGAIDNNLLVKDYKEEDIPQILKEFFNSV